LRRTELSTMVSVAVNLCTKGISASVRGSVPDVNIRYGNKKSDPALHARVPAARTRIRKRTDPHSPRCHSVRGVAAVTPEVDPRRRKNSHLRSSESQRKRLLREGGHAYQTFNNIKGSPGTE
jgi:hypothetical protein